MGPVRASIDARMDVTWTIDPDVAAARTLPPEVYRAPAWFEALRERVLARSWHVVATAGDLPAVGSVWPTTLVEGGLDEPIVLTRTDDGLHALSNVCTHRANLVATAPGQQRRLRCGYHGRCWDLAGRYRSMPGMDGAPDFPGPQDDLPALPVGRWGPLVFAALDPEAPLEALLAPVRARIDALGPERLRPAGTRDYELAAPWALYCDNYLEGFHVPFVHPALARTLDLEDYRYELHPWGNLQIGIAREGDPTLPLPPDHPDAGERIAAYYFWLFPTTMLNFYPWGLSLNVVVPLGPDRTRIRYGFWVWDERAQGRGAGADLDTVELEDQAVVAQVARGVRARRAIRGRYSPQHERGVHHFHRLLTAALARGDGEPAGPA